MAKFATVLGAIAGAMGWSEVQMTIAANACTEFIEKVRASGGDGDICESAFQEAIDPMDDAMKVMFGMWITASYCGNGEE